MCIRDSSAAALLAGSLLASPAMASEKIRWQVPLAFPSHLVGLTTPVKHLSESLKAISGGDIQLRYYEPGELVPPFEIMNAVSSGKYPAGYTWIGYDPVSYTHLGQTVRRDRRHRHAYAREPGRCGWRQPVRQH